MCIKGFYINGSVQKHDYGSLDNKPASGNGTQSGILLIDGSIYEA